MKIAIHSEKNNFSEKWIQYCIEHGISYKIVNCFDSNIIQEVEDCKIILWHWNHAKPESFLFARQLVISLEMSGKIVFPSIHDCWHYDDKIGQKYLLESIGAPVVPSYVFYKKNEAISWALSASYPKVFKLRGGYGSNNVALVKNKNDALKLIKRAFGKGFSQTSNRGILENRLWKLKRDKNLYAVVNLIKGFGKVIFGNNLTGIMGNEKGYIYFQDFLPNNDYDTRLVVIGNRCFGVRRYNRENDFRASGSGLLKYEKDLFDGEAVKLAFDVAGILKTQSLAFDIIYNESSMPVIVEVSYCYSTTAYDACEGYWTRNLEWIPGTFNLQQCILEDLVQKAQNTSNN